jgi:hypothetical protein
LIRSRWALAASVGLLLVASLFLPSRFTQRINSGGNTAGPFTADNDIRRGMKKEHNKKIKEHENKTKTDLGAEAAPPDGFGDLLDLSSIK